MSGRRGRRVALIGLSFLVTDLAAIISVGPMPWIDDGTTRLQQFYEVASQRLLTQQLLRGTAMVLLLWFAAEVVVLLRRPEDATTGTLVLNCAIVVAAIELVRVAIVSAVAVQPDRIEDGALVPLHAAQLILGAVIAFPITGAQLALSGLIRRGGLPRWLVVTAIASAAAWIVTSVRIISRVHLLWASGTVATLLWGLWLVALCVVLWRRTEGSPGRTEDDAG